MKNPLNKRLISAIEECIPEEQSTASFLADILATGKEAVYRRLRGDVLFSFDEVAKISRTLNLSLDNIVGATNTDKVLVELSIKKSTDPIEGFQQMLLNTTRRLERLNTHPNSKSSIAFNILPWNFYLSYDNLARFSLYKWLYQSSINSETLRFSDFILPAGIKECNQKFVFAFQEIKQSCVILDWSVFLAFIKDIDYFVKLDLITRPDLLLIQKELLALLNEIESLTISGHYNNGNTISIYLSNIEFETPYAHLESDSYEFCHIRIFSINGINSENSEICRDQKGWIETLKRYSTLITQSGEIQRAAYFKIQREHIRKLSNVLS
jgi:hypothetical protein